MTLMLFIGIALLVTSAFLKPQWLFALLSLVVFGLYFDVTNGYWLHYFVFVLGIILLVIEIYIPGFGIAGILGVAATVGALYWYIDDIYQVLLYIAIILLEVLFIAYMFIKLKKPILLGPGFVLETALNKPLGFSANKDLSFLQSEVGMALTDLRPVGRAQFGEDIYDVISELDMITRETKIIVIRVEGSKIYVRKEH